MWPQVFLLREETELFTLIKKVAPLCAAVALVAATITPSFAAHPRTGNKFSLVVYSHLTTAEVKVIQNLASQWAYQNGGSVHVVADTGTFQSFNTLSRSGRPPDAMFGIPDDNYGTFVKGGLVASVPSGTFNPDDYVPAALPAVTLNGTQYAVPLMLDTYTLVYNKKLVKTAPKSFDQLVKIAQGFPNTNGKTFGFMYDPTNFYFSYAFIRGCGGYVFKQSGANVDTGNIGLNNAGAVKALTFLQQLTQKYKLIPANPNGNIIGSLFQKGQLAMWIDGDWDISVNHKALGANFGAAPLPNVPGCGAPHPFAGVQVAFVNALSKNQALTWQLIKWLLPRFSMPDFQASGRIPARKADLNNSVFKKDPILSAYAKSALAGDPLPNVPEMQAVWTPAANAITLLIQGKATPQTAANNMVTQIKQGIAVQHSS